MSDTMTDRPPADQAPAHTRRPSAGEWMKTNLFSTWYNSVLTIVFVIFFLWVIRGLINYFVGIDLTIIRTNLTLYMVGRFPRDELLRLWIAAYLTVGGIALFVRLLALNAEDQAREAGLEFSPSSARDMARRFWPLLALIVVTLLMTETFTPTLLTLVAGVVGFVFYRLGDVAPKMLRTRSWLVPLVGTIAFYFAVAGFPAFLGFAGTSGVGWDDWGGFFLNIVLTVAGISLAFPLGLLLALGRRSTLPVVRVLSVTYIEFLRGVPMISLLLMGAFALGFLIPGDTQFSLFLRLLIAITLFQSAYIAEVVRGGLQSVPAGQVEASQALGMAPWKTMRLIVLPQALRNVIPAMVGQFISLFKDTTLVSIVGLLDLLRAALISTAQPEFLAQGLETVTLPFAALYFWVGSYVMSRESRRLEKKLGVGTR